MWRYRGQERPPFATDPRDQEESVWDYPRPPALDACDRRVTVHAGPALLAESSRVIRVLETASPPGIYLPPDAVQQSKLRLLPGNSYCEWKGRASYWALHADDTQQAVAWSYAQPTPPFAAIAGWFSFYPGRLRCRLNGAEVAPQEGGFYGGWITPEIVGPCKGGPGTSGW